MKTKDNMTPRIKARQVILDHLADMVGQVDKGKMEYRTTGGEDLTGRQVEETNKNVKQEYNRLLKKWANDFPKRKYYEEG